MITTLNDNDGKVIAYLESWLVGESGFHKAYGEYLWVNDLWIHEKYRGEDTLQRLVWKTLVNVPTVKYGYWTREKYNGRKSRLYKIEEFDKLIKTMEKRYGWKDNHSTASTADTAFTS